jgi:hypothetical protein
LFQGIDASGSVTGAIKTTEPPASGGIALRYAAFIRNLRDAIDARIRERFDGDERAIATALLTGRRDAITTPVDDAAAIIGLLRDRMRTFDELSDKWEVAVFMLPNPPDSMARRRRSHRKPNRQRLVARARRRPRQQLARAFEPAFALSDAPAREVSAAPGNEP